MWPLRGHPRFEENGDHSSYGDQRSLPTAIPRDMAQQTDDGIRRVTVILFKRQFYLKPVGDVLEPFQRNDPAITSLRVSQEYEDSGNFIAVARAYTRPTGAVPCEVVRLRTGPKHGPRTGDIFRFMRQATIVKMAFEQARVRIIEIAGYRHYQSNIIRCIADDPECVKIHRDDRSTSRGAKRVFHGALELGCVPKDFHRHVRAGTPAHIVAVRRTSDGKHILVIAARMLGR